jgi:hypothetical protein
VRGGGTQEGQTSGSATAESLYATFRKKVEVFIAVCKGLGEKSQGSRAHKDALDTEAGHLTHNESGEGMMERLVVMLDLTEYYGKRPEGRA